MSDIIEKILCSKTSCFRDLRCLNKLLTIYKALGLRDFVFINMLKDHDKSNK